MNAEVLEQILSCPTLPTLPAVAVRVVELTQRKDTPVEELAKVIQSDQALSLKVLKTVNSSFYGLRQRCTTINQSLVMLGLSTIKSLALGFSLVGTVNTAAGSTFDLVTYWRRGVYTAVAAKSIADAAHKSAADEAFLGGLLQDVGMMAMHQALYERYDRVVTAAGDHRRLARLELVEFELQHSDIGAMLAERWRLPGELVLPVKYHERPTASPGDHAEIVRCVGLGNMAHDVLTDSEPGPAIARYRAHAKMWFELDEAASDELLARIALASREMSGLFRLDTGAAADVEAVLAKARGGSAAANSEPGAPAHGLSLVGLVTDSDRVDPLTGALGRDECLRLGDDLFFVAQAQARPLAVLVIALDRFAGLVASHGVDAGDAALVETVTLLGERFERKGGIVGRVGDDAMIVILPGQSRADAVHVASGLRADVETESARWGLARGPGPASITISVGIAAYEPGPNAPFRKLAQLHAAATRAAQAAATSGGNTVRAFVPKAAAA